MNITKTSVIQIKNIKLIIFRKNADFQTQAYAAALERL